MKQYKCPYCKMEVEVINKVIIVICRTCQEEMKEVKGDGKYKQ